MKALANNSSISPSFSSNSLFTPEFSISSSFSPSLLQTATDSDLGKKKSKDYRHISPSFAPSSSTESASKTKSLSGEVFSSLYEYFGPLNFNIDNMASSSSSFLENFIINELDLPPLFFSLKKDEGKHDGPTTQVKSIKNKKGGKNKKKGKVDYDEEEDDNKDEELDGDITGIDGKSKNIILDDSVSRIKNHIKRLEKSDEHIIVSILLVERIYGFFFFFHEFI
jgi:hypothetical protein